MLWSGNYLSEACLIALLTNVSKRNEVKDEIIKLVEITHDFVEFAVNKASLLIESLIKILHVFESS